MQLRWPEEAASGLERITNYLFEKTPQHAPEMVTCHLQSPTKHPSALLTFPHRGRPGKKENTRELVLSPLPYILVYRIAGDAATFPHSPHFARRTEMALT